MARKPSTEVSVKRNDIWMPIYWGDYAKDTGHLSAAQHGAYLMLIKHYWVTRSALPDDETQLWRIACCDSLAHWRKISGIVLAFFDRQGGLLGHKRIEAELAKSSDRRTKASEAARLKWEQERRKRAAEEHANAYANAHANASPEHAPSICLDDASHSHSIESSSSTESGSAREAQRGGGARLARSAARQAMDETLKALAERKRTP